MRTRLYHDKGENEVWRDRIEGAPCCPANSYVTVRKDSAHTTLWVTSILDKQEGEAKIYLDEEGVRDLIASLKTPAPKDKK